jgi:hypothetical protein
MNSFYYAGMTYYYYLDYTGIMIVIDEEQELVHDDYVINLAHAEYLGYSEVG